MHEDSRELLEFMPFVGQAGISRSDLQELTGMTSEALQNAIGELASRSILIVRGSVLKGRLYGVHRLTISFVRSEIVGWDDFTG